MQNRVASIVVTYNGQKWIRKCIDSLIDSSQNTDIFVVDNASEDNTLEIINYEFPNLHSVIGLKSNLGFGRANNVGIKRALRSDYDYFFLLNQDAWVQEDAIKSLIHIHKNNNDYGILSPFHLDGSGKSLDFKFIEYIAKSKNIIQDIYFNKIDQLYEISFVNAAAWLISKSCVKKTGLFSPLFFHYGEDINYVQRVQSNGFRIGVCPDSIVWHDRTQSRSEDQHFTDPKQAYTRRAKLALMSPLDTSKKHVITEGIILGLIKSIANMNVKNLQHNIWKIFERRRLIKEIQSHRNSKQSTHLDPQLGQ